MTRLFALVPSQWASGDVCEIFSFTIKVPALASKSFSLNTWLNFDVVRFCFGG